MRNYIVTHSGRKFDFFADRPDFNIEDIAHSLSMLARWNGHSKTLISVAAHSIAVSYSDCIPEEHRLGALLHDAMEAYIGDIPTPLKRQLPELMQMERQLEDKFEVWSGVNWSDEAWKFIKRGDLSSLLYERTVFHNHPSLVQFNIDEEGGLGIYDKGISHVFKGYIVSESYWERMFMKRYHELIKLS
jgi:hypothetical protein